MGHRGDKEMKTAILLVKIWTMGFNSFYIPTDRDATVSIDTKDGVHCRASFEHKKTLFKLKCEKNLKTVIYFEDGTPEIKTTMMANDIIVKIGQ